MNILSALEIIRDPATNAGLARAWKESCPGSASGHEEGGFIVFDKGGQLKVVRWPTGEQNQIRVPAHAGCMIDGQPIAASFHTHPNIGPEYLQEPSETDKRGVRDDAELKADYYAGEIIITNEMVYLVKPDGAVGEIESRMALLG
jgi:hypothetical protein